MMLTIAIPTYNRNVPLLNTVSQLLPQLTDQCRLIVLDNHSTIPVEETLRPLLAGQPAVDCTLLRHHTNCGGNANILRCFELCETPWLWVLGDDDEVLPHAISTILRTISEDPERTYVNYSSEIYLRPQKFVTTGLAEFADKMDYFGNAMFISASIYNCQKVRSQLALAAQYSYSCAAQVLIVILSLRENDRCLFSDERIVRWEHPAVANAYSAVGVSIGRNTLLEVSLPPAVRISLAHAISASAYPLRTFARELFYRGTINGDFQTSRSLYDQLTYRLYYFDRRIATRLAIFAYRFVLRFPQLFQNLNRWSAKLLRRRINPFFEPTRNRD